MGREHTWIIRPVFRAVATDRARGLSYCHGSHPPHCRCLDTPGRAKEITIW